MKNELIWKEVFNEIINLQCQFMSWSIEKHSVWWPLSLAFVLALFVARHFPGDTAYSTS